MIPTKHSNITGLTKQSTALLKTEKVKCPLCESDDYRQKYKIGLWKIVQCDHCQFVYVNPRLQNQELIKIYTSNYFNNREVGYYHYTENKSLRKKNFQKWVTDALPFLASQTSMKALDVGCAAGYCLEVFNENHWIPYGIELDKSIAHELRQKGFIVFDTPLIQLDTAEKFDLISLFDVVEHLTDLSKNANILYSLLKDEGIIVLVTPNYESWQRKLFRKKWFQFKPLEHINYFSKKTLQKIADDNGFKIVYCKKSGQYCDTAFLENRLKKYNFEFLLPLFRIVIKCFRLKEKHFYADTASLYVVLKKKSCESVVTTPIQPSKQKKALT